MKASSDDVRAVARLSRELCGVVIDESKDYLVESRLSTIAEQAKVKSFTDLCQLAARPEARELRRSIIDAITTHETLFFRDNTPFEALRWKILPELMDVKRKSADRRIRIWSCACSTGQEVYSIAMTVFDIFGSAAAADVSVLGTDVSDQSVQQSSAGAYSDFEVERGLTRDQREKYFTRTASGWRVTDLVRAMCRFQRVNLLEQFADRGPFDIVFCRNVAIYFDAATRLRLFERLAETMTRTGVLFVGCSENLTDLGPRFVPSHHCRAAVYQPNQPVRASV